jgi:uncharacterized repeat protein (TIGR01451 family)
MQKLTPIFVLFFLFHINLQILNAQCAPSDNCSEVTCLIGTAGLEDGLYFTGGYTPGSAPGFCGTIENEQWFGVIAIDNAITVTASPSNCTYGNGIQVAFYKNCGDPVPIACYAGVSGGYDLDATFSTTEAIPGDQYFILVDGYAGDECQFTLTAEGIATEPGTRLLKGIVALDQNLDCVKDSSDTPLSGIKVNIETNHLTVRSTKADGTFKYSFIGSDSVLVYLDPIMNGFWQYCEDTIVVIPQILPDTSFVTFLMQPKGALCPAMDIEVGLPSFIRPCMNMLIPIKSTNFGNTAAENTTIQFIYPAQLGLIFDSASITPSNLMGDSLIFNIGSIEPFKTKEFNIYLKTPCNTTLINQTLCFSGQVFASNNCPQLAISYPKVKVDAECVGDSTLHFTIQNVGGAPMLQPSTYRIIKNSEIVENGPFMLQNGANLTLNYLATGDTYRLEANQSSYYPGFSRPSVSVEGCGGLTSNFINVFAQNDFDPDFDAECRLVVAAFDPNIKTASPSGVGTDHIIEANQPLEYVIEFQNTGTDTAFLVVLEDILPPTLAVHSLKPGPSSHPYTWEINDNNTLSFRFANILLPDSMTNPAASIGFVEFTIDQIPDLPIGTRIENYADIYFDINAPIRTPTAFHTIGKLLLVSIQETTSKTSSQWEILGNPTVNKAIFTNPKASNSEHLFQLIDVQGKLVNSEVFFGNRFEFERKQLTNGVYFFKIMDEKGGVSSGKIVVE